ncbi:MAG: lysophospholipid acyltransferase family protein, partial [Gammaproteobacteria bacterium]
YRFISQWSYFNLWCLKKICRLRYEVHGREHIPQGACVILCKHQSAWETYALPRIFPQPLAWVCKRELLWIPFFGWGFAMLQPIAIDRGAGRRALDQLVEQGMQRLKQGRPVVIFPEGTRVAPGEKRRYAIGGAMLAEKSGYPVLPIAHNAGVFWPRNSFIKYPGTIRVVIGPVIESKGKSADEINAQAEKWIEGAASSLSLHNTGGSRS